MNEFRTFYERKRGEESVLKDQLKTHNKDLVLAEALKLEIEQAQQVIQLVSQQTQEQLQEHIGDLVTKALEIVFDDPYKFILRFPMKGSQTEAVMKLELYGDEISPKNGDGGGVKDIIGFALRVSLWSLGHSDNVLILDEPFKQLSAEYLGKTSEMIKELSTQLGLQIILVTHKRPLTEVADKIFHVSLKKVEGEKHPRSQVIHR